MGCGRAVAEAPNSSRTFDTCCRGCASGRAHTDDCDAIAGKSDPIERAQNEAVWRRAGEAAQRGLKRDRPSDESVGSAARQRTREPAAPASEASDVAKLRAALALQAREMAHLHISILPHLSGLQSGLYEVPLDGGIGKYIQMLFKETAAQHRKSPEHDLTPAPKLRVVKVHQVVNEQLYEQYLNRVENMQRSSQDHSGFKALSDKFAHLRVHDDSLPPGRVNLNEYFAFHGATSHVVNLICQAGFDPQRGGEGRGKMFGVAAYFAVNVSKSDIYTEAPDRRLPRRSPRQIIVSRLALGHICRAVEQCPQMARAPDGYDSVYADTRKNGGCVDHPELMIYKEQQALPQYVVTYIHECPEGQLCLKCQQRPPH